jgi:hypothetical protein
LNEFHRAREDSQWLATVNHAQCLNDPHHFEAVGGAVLARDWFWPAVVLCLAIVKALDEMVCRRVLSTCGGQDNHWLNGG